MFRLLHVFFVDMAETTSLAKWSSMDLLTDEDDSPPAFTNKGSRPWDYSNSRLFNKLSFFPQQMTPSSVIRSCSGLHPSAAPVDQPSARRTASIAVPAIHLPVHRSEHIPPVRQPFSFSSFMPAAYLTRPSIRPPRNRMRPHFAVPLSR